MGECDGTGQCVLASTRSYRVFILSASLPELKPDGTPWDDDGSSGPDPFVEVRLDGTTVGTTPTIEDTVSASWEPQVTVDIGDAADRSLELVAFDEDGGDPELAFSCATTLTPDVLRSRDVLCRSADGSILAGIFPL